MRQRQLMTRIACRSNKPGRPQLNLADPFSCLCPRLLLMLYALVPFCLLATISWTRNAVGKRCRDTKKASSMSNCTVPVKLFTSSPSQSHQTCTGSTQSHLVDYEWWRKTKWYQFRLCKVSEQSGPT